MARGETYEAFVDKFKPKKTTDDCFTPQAVYDEVKKWACEKYEIKEESVVRPFWPGHDYTRFDYPTNCVVIDNPPFSILTQIAEFYLERGIPFFLFAPSLTAFSGRKIFDKVTHIICDCSIEYENGAIVKTSFITSFGGDVVAQTGPELTRRVNAAVKEMRKGKVKHLPKYEYPDHIITAAMMQRYAKLGIEIAITRSECVQIGALDAQKKKGKSIFGSGLLLSEKAAAEKAAAEKWTLSDREWEIVKRLK